VVAVVWQFETVPGRGEDFERFYGADGDWTKLSRRSRSFLGSSFLRDLAAPSRYLLVEYWSEMLVYEEHKTYQRGEFSHLDDLKHELVEATLPLGVFTALDVPERAGPTWSRRS